MQQVLSALITAIPFLWLLWLIERSPQTRRHGFHRKLYAASLTFLVFHLSVLCIPLLTVSYGFWDYAFARTGSRDYDTALDILGRLLDVPPFMVIGAMLLLHTTYRMFLSRRTLPGPAAGEAPVQPRRLRRMLATLWKGWSGLSHLSAVLLPLLLLVACVFYVEDGPFASEIWRIISRLVGPAVLIPTPDSFNLTHSDQSEYTRPIAFLLLVLVSVLTFSGLVLSFRWLLRLMLGRPLHLRLVGAAVTAMVMLPWLPFAGYWAAAQAGEYALAMTGMPITLNPAATYAWIWRAIVLAMGATVLWWLTVITMEIMPLLPVRRFLRSDHAWLILVPFLLLALPAQSLPGAQVWGPLGLDALQSMASGIDALLPYALLLGLVMLLRRYSPPHNRSLPPGAVEVGALLFTFYVTYLTGRADNLLLLPVPLLLGYLLFKYVLLAPSGADLPLTSAERSGLIQALLSYKQARRWVSTQQRTLEKKFSGGDKPLNEFRQEYEEGQKYLQEAAASVKLDPLTAEKVIFNYGPEVTPWRNARMAVLYGFFLSILFQKTTLEQLLRGESLGPFPLLELTRVLLGSCCTWLLLAFVFGHFFAFIRGHNGLTKALYYSGALIVPTIPLAVLGQSRTIAFGIPLLGSDDVVQMVQVMAFVLLLALLAFDLRTLEKSRYTWRDLLTVHGLTTAATYVVSIAATTVASFSGKDIFDFLQRLLLGGK